MTPGSEKNKERNKVLFKVNKRVREKKDSEQEREKKSRRDRERKRKKTRRFASLTVRILRCIEGK